MKASVVLKLFVVLVALGVCSNGFADMLTQQYGIDIKDTNSTDDGRLNLNNLFNTYFADQLAATGEGSYSTSNDLFNARGLDPNMIWTTNESSLAGAFKVAGSCASEP